MAHNRKGQLRAQPGQYQKHLRPFGRREFWKRERAEADRQLNHDERKSSYLGRRAWPCPIEETI